MALVPVFSKKHQLKQPHTLPAPKVATCSNLSIKAVHENLGCVPVNKQTKKPARLKGTAKPFRSLSDAEYNDIFAAVLNNTSSPLPECEDIIPATDKQKILEEEHNCSEDFHTLANEDVFEAIDECQVVPDGEIELFPLANIAEGINDPQQLAPEFVEDIPIISLLPSAQQLQTPDGSDDDAHADIAPKLKHKKKRVKRQKGVKRKHLNFCDQEVDQLDRSDDAVTFPDPYAFVSHNDAEVPAGSKDSFWQEKDCDNNLDDASVFTRSTSSKVVLGSNNVASSSSPSVLSAETCSTAKVASYKKKKRRISQKDYILKQQRERNIGTWVECSICHKWRYLQEVADPVEVPRFWTCSMNSDAAYDSCEKLQEVWSEDVDKRTIFNQFTAGSVVWAKIDGFPWWPALVDDDPDTEDFFFTDENSVTTHYNVVFFGEQVSRSWVSVLHIQPFKSNNADAFKPRIDGAKRYFEELVIAKQQALAALQMNIKSRLEKFGFTTRYRGKWPRHISSSDEEIPNNQSCVMEFKRQKATKRRKLKKSPANCEPWEPLVTFDLLESANAVMNALSDNSSPTEGSPIVSQRKKMVAKKSLKRNKEKTSDKKKRRAENDGLKLSKENVAPSAEQNKPPIKKHEMLIATEQSIHSEVATSTTRKSPLMDSEKRVNVNISQNKITTSNQNGSNSHKKQKTFKPPVADNGKAIPRFGLKQSKANRTAATSKEPKTPIGSERNADSSYHKDTSSLNEGAKPGIETCLSSEKNIPKIGEDQLNKSNTSKLQSEAKASNTLKETLQHGVQSATNGDIIEVEKRDSSCQKTGNSKHKGSVKLKNRPEPKTDNPGKQDELTSTKKNTPSITTDNPANGKVHHRPNPSSDNAENDGALKITAESSIDNSTTESDEAILEIELPPTEELNMPPGPNNATSNNKLTGTSNTNKQKLLTELQSISIAKSTNEMCKLQKPVDDVASSEMCLKSFNSTNLHPSELESRNESQSAELFSNTGAISNSENQPFISPKKPGVSNDGQCQSMIRSPERNSWQYIDENDSNEEKTVPQLNLSAPKIMGQTNDKIVNSEEQAELQEPINSTPDLFASELMLPTEDNIETVNLDQNETNKNFNSAAVVEYSTNSSPHSPSFEFEPIPNQDDAEASAICNVSPLDLEE